MIPTRTPCFGKYLSNTKYSTCRTSSHRQLPEADILGINVDRGELRKRKTRGRTFTSLAPPKALQQQFEISFS